jgi:sugar (pentulose or hexulose) kinase
MPKLSDDDVQALLEEGFTIEVKGDSDDPFVDEHGVSIRDAVASWDAVCAWLERCRALMMHDPSSIDA